MRRAFSIRAFRFMFLYVYWGPNSDYFLRNWCFRVLNVLIGNFCGKSFPVSRNCSFGFRDAEGIRNPFSGICLAEEYHLSGYKQRKCLCMYMRKGATANLCKHYISRLITKNVRPNVQMWDVVCLEKVCAVSSLQKFLRVDKPFPTILRLTLSLKYRKKYRIEKIRGVEMR